MTLRTVLALSLTLSACFSKESDDDDGDDWGDDWGDDTGWGGEDRWPDTGSGGGERPGFDNFIDTTVAPGGDLSCFTGSLGTEGPADGCVQSRTMSGTVVDFQTDLPVDEAKVELFLADGIFGAPDYTLTADPAGMVSAGLNTCEPFTSRISTDPLADMTKTTVEAHEVMAFAPVQTVTHELNSVSSTTYALIPSLLGVSPDPAKGIVAGSVYGCDDDPIEGAQVVVTDEDGNIPSGIVVRYFVEDFPNRNQPHTSADGLWIIMDVPIGSWNVNGYVFNDDGSDSPYTRIAATTLEVYADSINISSLFTGISDGVKMPSTCLEGCAR